MNAKFKQIIEQLNALVKFKADKSMSDDDFITDYENMMPSTAQLC